VKIRDRDPSHLGPCGIHGKKSGLKILTFTPLIRPVPSRDLSRFVPRLLISVRAYLRLPGLVPTQIHLSLLVLPMHGDATAWWRDMEVALLGGRGYAAWPQRHH
jgi:hypothetical protein